MSDPINTPGSSASPERAADQTEDQVTATAEAEAEAVRSKVAAAGTAAQERAEAHYETARGHLQDAAQAARDRAYEEAETFRNRAEDEVRTSAEAFREAASEAEGHPVQEQAMNQIAETMSHAADALRDVDIQSIPDDLSEFARRHPAIFLGGAALVGFALARFLKASSRTRQPDYAGREVGTVYGSHL